MRFLTCGADGILVELADLDETLRVFAALQSAVKHAVEQTAESPERAAQPSTTSVFAGVKQLIPAARTVYVAFDPLLSSRVELTAAIRALNVAADMERHSRIVEIPVIYDGEDMADVADLLGISVDEVVRRHCDTAWSVAFVGFAPGFAYLTGGDPIFDVPRRKVPRLSVPAGAVGLAGTFSGVYPRVSSGGWQLLGHTETPMWDERADPPALLQPGDTVRFTPVRDAVSGGSASVSASVSDSVQVSQAPDSMSVSASTPALEVLRSGLLTTFQDDGRVAANMGVTGSGAADRTSSHLANALVGNPANTPVLEITGGGVRMRAIGSVVVAVTGASADVTITGSRQSQDSQGGSNGTFTPNSPGGCSGRTVLNASNDAADRTTIAMQQPVLLRDGDVLSIAPPDQRPARLCGRTRRFRRRDNPRFGCNGHDERHRPTPDRSQTAARHTYRVHGVRCRRRPAAAMADRPAETRQTYGFIRAIGTARRLVHRSRPVRIPDANVDSDRAVEPCWPATFGSGTRGTHRHARTGQRGHAIRRNRSADQRTTGHFSARPACNRRISGNRRA